MEEVLSVSELLHDSEQVITLDEAPGAQADHGVVLSIQDDDSDEFRERFSNSGYERVTSTVVIRLALLMNPNNRLLAQDEGFELEQKIVVAMMTTSRDVLKRCFVKHRTTARNVHSTNEWYVTDLTFAIDWSRSFA